MQINLSRKGIAATILAIVWVAAPAGLCGAGPKPNVLFIIADDQNCQLGCYGNAVIKTPNIDRLAKTGMRFDRAYCNYPVCNASRTSFLSGRRPDTTGIFGNGTKPRIKLGDEYQFLPEYFHAHGYFTAGIGKIAHTTFADAVSWDVQTDPQRDHQEAQAKLAKRERKAKNQARKQDQTVPVPFEWHATENDDAAEPDGVTARKVAKLMEEHSTTSSSGGPFFIAAGFHKPHLSHTAPKKYFDLYPPDQMKSPVEPPIDTQTIPKVAYPPKYFGDLTEEQNRHIISHYYAASTFMDAQVGVLLETLDHLKLWDNTIVVFIGDHGWHLGEHGGFYAKMSLMKESARSPLVVYAPGKTTSAVCQRMIEYVDLFPTLTELCELPPQPGVEGNSFVSLLVDPQSAGKPFAQSVVSRGRRKESLGRSLYTEKWTYIEWPDGSQQLYDYAADPYEYKNLAGDAQHASTVAELQQTLHRLQPADSGAN